MSIIEEILRAKIKPKEKQIRLVEAILSGTIAVEEFIAYFESAKDSHKGSCADAMKHVAEQNPALLAPYIETLLQYINHPLPRVKWGIPEAFGHLAKEYPEKASAAIPFLLRNTTDNDENSTVIKWCAAFGLTEIAKSNSSTREQLIPLFEHIIKREQNNGVRNVYQKALKTIGKDSSV